MMDDFDFDGGDLPETPASPQTDGGSAGMGGDDAGSPAGGQGRRFADEVFSVEHRGRYRTFYMDLKESRNGKFLKIKEKGAGGRSSVIMMDAEDIAPVIEALQKVQEQL